MAMMLSEVAAIVGGNLIGADVSVASVSIDTRLFNPGQLYIAIKGQQFDGNDFLPEAEAAGAAAAIVNTGIAQKSAGKVTVPLVEVNDTHDALAKLAAAWRQRSQVKAVFGVTGSNGKTTVKEMLAAILGVNDSVLYTKGNLNNDIGVPLTLLRLTEEHRYAVIEMGANHPKEIEYTSRIAKPDVALITNVGAAHIEGFGSLNGVAKTKGEIFETLSSEGIAVINRDDAFYAFWLTVVGGRQFKTFGLSSQADVTAKSIATKVEADGFVTRFELQTAHGAVTVNLKLAGRHNVMNALAASAACLAAGISLEQIKQGLEHAQPVTGRLQLLHGRLGNRVIDDTYNANSASLKAGLDVLSAFPGKRWLVLGAFGELGDESLKIHQEIAAPVKASGVERLLAVGADTKQTVDAFGEGATFFATQDELIAALTQELKGDETILIKGSRAQQMENVARALVDNFRK